MLKDVFDCDFLHLNEIGWVVVLFRFVVVLRRQQPNHTKNQQKRKSSKQTNGVVVVSTQRRSLPHSDTSTSQQPDTSSRLHVATKYHLSVSSRAQQRR